MVFAGLVTPAVFVASYHAISPFLGVILSVYVTSNFSPCVWILSNSRFLFSMSLHICIYLHLFAVVNLLCRPLLLSVKAAVCSNRSVVFVILLSVYFATSLHVIVCRKNHLQMAQLFWLEKYDHVSRVETCNTGLNPLFISHFPNEPSLNILDWRFSCSL